MKMTYVCSLAAIGAAFFIGCHPSADDGASREQALAGPHPMNLNPPTDKRVGALKAPAIISNGTVQLGVNEQGNLNAEGGTPSAGSAPTSVVGLRYVPSNGEATAPGCLCEGWGVADAGTGIFGSANRAIGGVRNMAVESFTNTADSAVSVVNVEGTLRVTHDYRPSPITDFLYEVTVTIENISGGDLSDIRYTRGMDWDIAPNTFSEFVTIEGTAGAANLLLANNNGFQDVNPLISRTAITPFPTLPANLGDFIDAGPADHGAHFDFGFGALAAGEIREFTIFYGAAGTELDARTALGLVGAEVFSLGQANWDGVGDPTVPGAALGTGSFGAATGEPGTFIFGFKGIGRNARPIANAGPDQILGECAGEDISVTLDGSGSSDEEGDPLTFRWLKDGVEIATGVAPTITLGPGVHEIDLVVNDGQDDSLVADTVVITIAGDPDPPVLTVLGDDPTSVECGAVYEDAGATAIDECSGDLSADIVTDNPVDSTVAGSYLVSYEVADEVGNLAQASRAVEVVDTTAPDVTVGEMIQVFPPDYEYLTLSLSDCVVAATDICESTIDVDALGQIISIASDEPDVVPWADSDPGDDIVILDHSTFMLRKQRRSVENGRVYRVTFVVSDSAGNATDELTCDVGIKVFDDGGCHDIPVYDGPEHIVTP